MCILSGEGTSKRGQSELVEWRVRQWSVINEVSGQAKRDSEVKRGGFNQRSRALLNTGGGPLLMTQIREVKGRGKISR